MMTEARQRSFPPVVDSDTRVLILGSLPGAASLAAQRYYAHPRNQFWRLTGALIGHDLASFDYNDRLAVLREAGIGLWDVVAEAHRPGSLDAAIRNAVPSDLASLIAGLPRLRAIAFNGGTAARLGRKVLVGATDLPLIDLPSSSPAFTLAFADKLRSWERLRVHIDGP